MHKHAFIHYVKNTSPESISSLLKTDIEYMIYNLLLEDKLVGVTKVPLLQRLQQVIDKMRPYIKKYNENIELLCFKPPDTLEISLIHNYDSKSTSNAKISSKIEQSIQYYCPEITKIIIVK
ncbi:MAG: NifU family protein [Richelia sp.]|nr:NifU family protein [Richelia sp.]